MSRTSLIVISILLILNVLTLCVSKPRLSLLNAVRFNAAMRSIKNEEFDKAQGLFIKIVKSAPCDSRALRDLGQIYQMKGEKSRAVDCFSRAAHLGDLQALDSLAGLYLEQTNYAQIAVLLPVLRQQTHSNPRIAEKLIVFSMAVTNRGLWAELESQYAQGLLPSDTFSSNLNATAKQFFSGMR